MFLIPPCDLVGIGLITAFQRGSPLRGELLVASCEPGKESPPSSAGAVYPIHAIVVSMLLGPDLYSWLWRDGVPEFETLFDHRSDRRIQVVGVIAKERSDFITQL